MNAGATLPVIAGNVPVHVAPLKLQGHVKVVRLAEETGTRRYTAAAAP